GVASDSNVTEIEGKPLSDEEASAQATAANVLSKYFAGQLPLDIWEFERLKAEIAGRLPEGQAGVLMRCLACVDKASPVPGCRLCGGSGDVVVYAAAPRGQAGS